MTRTVDVPITYEISIYGRRGYESPYSDIKEIAGLTITEETTVRDICNAIRTELHEHNDDFQEDYDAASRICRERIAI